MPPPSRPSRTSLPMVTPQGWHRLDGVMRPPCVPEDGQMQHQQPVPGNSDKIY